MDALRRTFALTANLEATLEANPGTVNAQSLKELRAAGLNRLSFGVQSANPNELRLLERAHDFFDVIQSVKWARQAGFKRLNLDLIYGLPEQTLPDWQNSVKRIADLNPEHISMYALTIEHGTPFGHWAAHGLLPLPNPDLAADMYEWAAEYLNKHIGYTQYEISNWAFPGEESRHNLQYWRNLPYYGFGAGAHGYIDGARYANVPHIKPYIENRSQPKSATESARTAMQETLMLGLRLTQEGVSNSTFRNRFGMGIAEAFPREIAELTQLGLLEWHEADTLRLTPHARLIGNQVFMRFVD
jgi:oxygen-independent coproporphyrinogen III oxidase